MEFRNLTIFLMQLPYDVTLHFFSGTFGII